MLNIWILALSMLGFSVSGYIFYKKKKNQKLTCVIGKNCEAVVNSKYNKFFGVPNEVIGMFYYLLAALSAALLYFNFKDLGPVSLNFLLVIASGGAATYSFVLILIQTFILKEWCEYCLVSAGVSIIIFVLKIIPLIALY